MHRPRHTIPALLFSALMIPGCAKEPPGPVTVEVRPSVVDEAVRVGCPPAAPDDRAEASRRVPRPAADVRDIDGRPAISRQATQAWIDAHEVDGQRKRRVIGRLIGQIDVCRGERPAVPVVPARPSA